MEKLNIINRFIKGFIKGKKDPKYPIIIEISGKKSTFKVDIRDPNFDRPLSELTTIYQPPIKRKTPVNHYTDFELITIND